jgi:hypothetical protein
MVKISNRATQNSDYNWTFSFAFFLTEGKNCSVVRRKLSEKLQQPKSTETI